MKSLLETMIERARCEGAHVEYADLGDWGGSELRSEYDPHGQVIRVNVRSLQGPAEPTACERAALAIAHELYHHRECLGAVPRLPTRAAREAAAARFARELCKP